MTFSLGPSGTGGAPDNGRPTGGAPDITATGRRIHQLAGVVTAGAVAKLADAGIVTARAFLAAADTVPHRNKLADRLGIGRDLIRTWFNHCNVMRIKGVGPKFAALLELSGVDSPKKLATHTLSLYRSSVVLRTAPSSFARHRSSLVSKSLRQHRPWARGRVPRAQEPHGHSHLRSCRRLSPCVRTYLRATGEDRDHAADGLRNVRPTCGARVPRCDSPRYRRSCRAYLG